jgi:hypothetical protein
VPVPVSRCVFSRKVAFPPVLAPDCVEHLNSPRSAARIGPVLPAAIRAEVDKVCLAFAPVGYAELVRLAASMALYDKPFIGEPPLAPLSDTVTTMLTIWCILLVLGALPGLMLTGMAFEGGDTFGAYYSVTTVWLYPPLVAVAYLCRRRSPRMVWLPLIPVTLILLSLATNWP